MKNSFFTALAILFLSACTDTPTTHIVQERVDIVVTASGELESSQTSMIAPPSVSNMWQYKIKTLIPENSTVKKGDLLVSFDDKKISEMHIQKQAEYQQAVKQRENKKRAQKAKEEALILKLAEAKMQFDKAKRKAEIIDGGRTEVEKRKARIDFTIAENELFLAKERLNYHQLNAERNLQQATNKVQRLNSEVKAFEREVASLAVKASMDGVVIYEVDWNGEKPAVGESMQFGQSVIRLAVIEKMQVKAQIEEPDSGKVTIGQRVKIYLEGKQENLVYGTVRQLGKIFRNKSHQDKRRIFDAIIDFDEVNTEKMRPGISARLEIVTSHLDKALVVPKAAIKTTKAQAHILQQGIFSQRTIPVEVKHVIGEKAIINSPKLAAGEEILL